MRLDVGTLAFSTAVLSLALSMTTAFIAAGRGDRLIRFCFSGSNALYGAGLLTVVFWRAEPAALISGNTLVMASALCAHLGACAYAGKTVKPIYYLPGIAAVILGTTVSFTEWGGGTGTRIIVISGVRLLYFAHAAYAIMISRKQGVRTATPKILAMMFASYALLLLIRIADIIVSGTSGHIFIDWTGFQAAYYLVVAAIMLSMVVAFALMCAEEDEQHLRRTIELRTAELREAKGLAEHASAAKTRFITAASHDLRQPVHTLRLLISAAEGLAPTKGAELNDLIAEMKASATRLADYLHALLDISRLEAGVIVPELRDVPLGNLLAELDTQFRQEAIAAGVRLHVVRSSCVVRTDPLLLKRILANLISNAIKFAEGRAVVVGCRRQGSNVAIQVCDNGCGIGDDAIAEIFDEFRQIGNDARQASKGFGLGLNIAKGLCAILEHRISVSSRLGHGTTFGVITPLNVKDFNG